MFVSIWQCIFDVFLVFSMFISRLNVSVNFFSLLLLLIIFYIRRIASSFLFLKLCKYKFSSIVFELKIRLEWDRSRHSCSCCHSAILCCCCCSCCYLLLLLLFYFIFSSFHFLSVRFVLCARVL